MEQPDRQKDGTRAGYSSEWWRALALFLIVVGARFWLIERYSTAMPYWDQWDGIGGLILKPSLEGHLDFRAFFVPHNEHRIVLTRLLSLAIFAANGQWDNLLESAVNAVFVGFSAVCFAGILTSFLHRKHPRVVFLAVAVYFVLPFGWENTLSGFQSQNYFLNLFSVLAIWGLVFRVPGSRGWWVGLASLVLACLSMATGFFAAVVAGVALAVRGWSRRRRPSVGEIVTLIICIGAAAVGWLTHVEVPTHASLRAEGVFAFLMAMLRYTAWPVYRFPLCGFLAVIPVILLAARALRRPANNKSAEAHDRPLATGGLLALGLWVLLQTAAMAYGRGGHSLPPACRYMDLLALGPLINFLAWVTLADGSRTARRRLGTLACAAVWTVLLAGGLWAETTQDFRFWLPWYRNKVQHGEQNLRACLATGDFTKSLAGKPPEELPYPDPDRLAALLDDTLRPTLPAEIRLPLTPRSVEYDDTGFLPRGHPRIHGPQPDSLFWNCDTMKDGSAKGRMRATFVSKTPLPYLRFLFAGDLGAPGLRFSLRDPASGRGKRVATRTAHRRALAPGLSWETEPGIHCGSRRRERDLLVCIQHTRGGGVLVLLGRLRTEAGRSDHGGGNRACLLRRTCCPPPTDAKPRLIRPLAPARAKPRLAASAFRRYLANSQGQSAGGRAGEILSFAVAARGIRACGVFPSMVFDDLQLSEDVQLAVRATGFTEPTPIQQAAIPLALAGRDVIGSAQTGTGKTAAFALPILTRLDRPHKSKHPRALIIEPTRELAYQVEAAFRMFGRFSPVRVGVMYGGVGYGKQSELLAKGIDVWVVTPGRALDYLERGELSFKELEVVVLDEADRLLDMGFLPDVRRMLEACPKERQTLLFSATIPPEIDGLVKWAMKTPETISIGMRQSPAETVTHNLYPCASAQKFELLHALLEHTKYESVIVFCRMKIGADQVAARLIGEGHKVAVLHSDRAQKEREESLAGFRDGTFEVLVATDIAARGLDIAGVTHVVNFDVPQHPEDYVHRIGRTGRAQKEGDALTIFTAEDVNHVQAIERFIGRPIPRVKIDTFDYLYTQLFNLKDGASLERLKVSGGRSGKGYSYSSGRKKR